MPLSDEFRRQGEYILEKLGKMETIVVSPLFEIGRNFCHKGDWDNAIKCFEQCSQLSEDLSPPQPIARAVAFVGLGAVHLCRNSPTRAAEYYLRAREIFSRLNENYRLAVVLLGLGQLYQAHGEWREVFKWYREALETLDRARETTDLIMKLREEILGKFKEAVDEYEQSLSGRSIKPNQPNQRDSKRIGSMRLFPVIGGIAAGRPVLAKENIEDYIVTNAFNIGGIGFSLQTIEAEDDTSLQLRPESTYFVLQVKGDSMINANIRDGDYVLVRRTPDAEQGEIVAIGIGGEGGEIEAVVKRFRCNGNRIYLESENPNIEPVVFQKGDPKIRILGSVEAVLKKTEE